MSDRKESGTSLVLGDEIRTLTEGDVHLGLAASKLAHAC